MKTKEQILECDKCNVELITDVKNLCKVCDILNKIKEVRDIMILTFENLKEVNNNDFLIEFINQKLEKGNGILRDMISKDSEHKGDRFVKNRISLILSWKDCVKYYSEQLLIQIGRASCRERV